MNKKAKGKRAEREYEKYLQSKGFLTWRPTWNRYSSKDIFNIADIIAIPKKEEQQEIFNIYEVLFIQVKTNRTDFYKARKQIFSFIDKIAPSSKICFVVALKIRGKLWRIWATDGINEKDETYNIGGSI